MKLAASFSSDREVNGLLVRRMLAAQDTDGGGGAHVTSVADGSGALGWLETSDRFTSVPLAQHSRHGNVLVVSGAPVLCGGGLATLLQQAVDAPLQRGAELLTRLDGGFAALLWNEADRQLAVVTDFHGLQPLHSADAAGAFLLATEQKAIAATGLVGLDPDPAGWGAFISFGHHVGARTTGLGVHRVAPSAVLIRDSVGRAISERRHWTWPSPSPVGAMADVDVAAIYRALVESVEAYRDYGLNGTVLMSGGFDSRLILGTLREIGITPRGVIVRHEDEHGDADGQFAARSARLLGIEPEIRTPPRDFYSSDGYRRYLLLSEVCNTSLGLFISRVSAEVRPELQAVWEGVAPNILKRLDRNPRNEGFSGFLDRACQGESSPAWKAAAAIFSRDWLHEMRRQWDHALQEEVARYTDDEFGVGQFSAFNRLRNRLATNPYRVYANDVLPFSPALTRAFFDLAGGLRGDVKGKGELTIRLLREHMPHTLQVPFCSGGKLIPGANRRDPGLQAAQVRAAVLKNNVVRRGLRRFGLHRPVEFDIETVRRDILAGVDDTDPRLDGRSVRALVLPAGGGAANEETDAARTLLFYWQVGRLLAHAPATLRPTRLAPEPLVAGVR